MSNDSIKQSVTIDAKEAIKAVKDFNQAVVSGATDANKAITQNSQVFSQNEKQIKTWGASVQEEFSKFKKSFTENLATGAKALALDAGLNAVRKGAKDAIQMAVDSSEAFAELKSRIGGSDEQMMKFQKSIASAAISTKTNLASMEKAFLDLSDSADPAQIQTFLQSVGQATLLAHGDQGAVTDYLKQTVVGQGKQLNKGTVDESIGAADLLRRRGRGFGSMESAMGALGGLNQEAARTSGLSERDIAAALAGASHSGLGANQASAGINAVLQANQNGIQQGSMLAGILGVSGKNALHGASGQLDFGKIANQQSYSRLMKMGGGDENKALEIFRTISGLGPEASDALFKMIKNFKEFNQTLSDSRRDTQSFAKSAEMAGDNIHATYQQMQDKIVVGFKDIIGPLMKPINSALGGHLGDAASQAPGALGGALSGMAAHPLLVGGGILATATGGALINGILSKIPGLGGLAGGVAKGSALKKAGVDPVYVVNAAEIGSSMGGASALASGGFMAIAKRIGLGAATLGTAGLGEIGAMGAGAMGLAGAGVAAAGAVGYGAGSLLNKVTGNDRGEMGSMLYDAMYGDKQSQKVIVEIHNKADGFDAKPTSKGVTRDGKTQ